MADIAWHGLSVQQSEPIIMLPQMHGCHQAVGVGCAAVAMLGPCSLQRKKTTLKGSANAGVTMRLAQYWTVG